MQEYESIFVLDPDVDDSQVDVEVEKIREIITTRAGEITEVQKWGRRKLAYEIRKKKEGVYTLVRFKSGADGLIELNRRFRLNEQLLRHLTVIYEGPAPGEFEGEARDYDDSDGGHHDRPHRSRRRDDDDDDEDSE
jgi:small subunit ribosomal protein S6